LGGSTATPKPMPVAPATMLLENEGHVRCKRWLSDELVIVGVSADPEPNEILTRFDRKCAVLQANARRPEATHLFEMKGRMPRIALQVLV
jgi:predicted transcriptional regulator